MSKVFFGFGIADNMFGNFEGMIQRTPLSVDQAKTILAQEGLNVCLNPSHQLTIDAMNQRFGIYLPIPDKAPLASLATGDTLVVMGVRGLPRLEGRHEYTEDEISSAVFSFSSYTLVG